MSIKIIVCGVCEYRNINKPSVVWCSECDEGLCEECKEHHAASKSSRTHSTVLVSEYQNLPTNILEITQTCPKHNENYVIFCKKHDTPCCRRCVVETHNDCKEINALDDVVRNVKLSSAFVEMEQMLVEFSENVQRIRKDREENIKSLIENRTKVKKEVQQARILIDNHLDKLQESLIKELYDVEKKESTKIKNTISSILENERKILETRTTLGKIKQHASDLQTFLALKHIQQDVTSNEQFLESLIKEKKINNVSMSWEIEKSVEILSTTIKKMGTIQLDTRSADATLTVRKNQQAQMMMPITHAPTIDDIKLTVRQTVKTTGKNVIDCCLLPDGRMIFSCYTNSTINVLKTDGTLDFTLQQGSHTSHIHFIEESQKLVVTTGQFFSYINIIDMRNRKKEKSIDVRSVNYGIVHKDGILLYNGGRSGLYAVNLNDGCVTQLVKVLLLQRSSIVMWSDNLYFVNMDYSVSCCDLQGRVKWKLELKAFLQTPQSITVDNYGRVYVSGRDSNNVVVISQDGNKHRLLLSEKDGLEKPQSLFFDRKNNKLLVANQRNGAFIYEVSK